MGEVFQGSYASLLSKKACNLKMVENRVGFMQGRLSEIIDNKIQAFPWKEWQLEFKRANQLGIRNMEWTLDIDRIYENPIMTCEGRQLIRSLSAEYSLSIPSLTGDCFMQSPFWKCKGNSKIALQKVFNDVVTSASELDIRYIVVPIVDNGKISCEEELDCLRSYLISQEEFFVDSNIYILFESDYSPATLKDFIDSLSSSCFGINYDIGNSASLGYDTEEEIFCYGSRILNVHIKDRLLGGGTVPLGSGNAEFSRTYQALAQSNFSGNFILQSARSASGDHFEVLRDYYNSSVKLIAPFFHRQ